MDETKTPNTSDTKARGLAAYGDELPKNVGPFHRGEIETITRRCATRLGIDYDVLPIADRKQKLGIAVDVLTGTLPVRQLEDHRSRVPSEERTLGLMLLEEFKNSPKWDNDEFTRGYTASNVDTPNTSHAGGVGSVDPGIEQSSR